MLMSDSGSGAVNNVNLTFDDCARRLLPRFQPIVSGRYRPTNHGTNPTETLPARAPAEPYGTALAGFNGLGGSTSTGLGACTSKNQLAGGSAAWRRLEYHNLYGYRPPRGLEPGALRQTRL